MSERVEPMAGDLEQVREIRARYPDQIAEAARRRHRRPLLGTSGRLLLVAADHPARNALGVRDRPTAMADRVGLLERLRTALARPGVDGVLATADVLEDLLLLGDLEGKLAVASMNRGGLQGAAFELDDRFTGYDVDSITAGNLDGGKMLVRIDLADPGTLTTLESCGRAVTELAAHRLMALVEPFWSSRGGDGRVHNELDADAVIRSVVVASALGGTSAHTWLKLPVVPDMERVMAATTLPTLLLGGDPSGAPAESFARWRQALTLPGVRGLVVGRALLFPPDDDVAGAVDAAAALVRDAS